MNLNKLWEDISTKLQTGNGLRDHSDAHLLELLQHLQKYEVVSQFDESLVRPNQNWRVLCQKLGTTPQKILLLHGPYAIPMFQETPNAPDTSEEAFKEHRLHFETSVLDELTRRGYCIRSIEDFVKCVQCDTAVLSAMRNPTAYSQFCVTCQAKST